MIYTHINDVRRYRGIGRVLDQALDLLERIAFEEQPEGRYIVSEKLFYTRENYETKPVEETAWESHLKYIDIQYIVEGVERMSVRNSKDLSVKYPYDEEKDIIFYEGAADDQITLSKGMAAILFPTDVHRPCIAAGLPSGVKKIIIKAAANW